jgi:hypothetical protein
MNDPLDYHVVGDVAKNAGIRMVQSSIRQVLLTSVLTLGFSYLTTSATFGAPVPAACDIKPVTYKGWNAQQLSNPWLTLIIAPELGGRLLQVTFGGHDFLFVNDQLKGQVHSPEESQEQKRWFNYGGDKIWPMPEGSQDEQHWAGAVGAVLDSALYSFQILSKDARCAVRLTGPPDPQIGLQYIRDISIGADSPAIAFHAAMRNSTGFPVKWSEQSVSQYDAADPQDPTRSKQNFWAFTPKNDQSAYLNGFHIRTGPGSNPTYSLRDNLFVLHWMEIGGEVWIDSPGSWLAVVDGDAQYTMVERFHVNPREEYPGKATVIFYTTGQRTGRRPTNPPAANVETARPPIHYMEAELNSPVIELNPGETYAMDTEWFPTRMGSTFSTATFSGVAGRPFVASKNPDGQLQLVGAFGVFFPGQLIAHLYNAEGLRIASIPLDSVSPVDPIELSKTIAAPAEASRISIHLIDSRGLDRGPLAEATISDPAEVSR